MLHYLIRKNYNDDYRIVVSSNDYEKYIESAPTNVTFVGNKQGIKYFLKSKYAFYCFGKYPIKPSKNQTVVNLWHGTPLKKIGNLEKGLEKIDYNFFTIVAASSPLYKPIMAKIFGCNEEQVQILGNPRNDELFIPNKKEDELLKKPNEKLILWLPTYREYNDDYIVSVLKKTQIEELNSKLKKSNIKMVIKMHPLQKADAYKEKHSNIKFMTQKALEKKGLSVYALLRNADALITDYSSAYFDYMLLNRPIGFAVEDMEKYKNKRGFIFDNPKEYMPGPEIRNLSDIEEFIENIVSGNDLYKEARESVNDKINYYKDGNCCKRVAETFIK